MSEIRYNKIQVSGEDAFDFLQAQLATDLSTIDEDGTQHSAWCNPKGRVICMPTISQAESVFEMSLPADLAESVLQRLTLFRFRARVEFAITEGGKKDVRAQLEQLRAGIAEITQSQSEKFTPHMLNLDLLGIVSLDKGCYPGQEIVARTHYRGASKRRCLRFESVEPVSAGDKVSDGDRDVGEVVNAVGTDLLAVVPVDADHDALMIRELPLTNVLLEYLK